MCRILGKTKNQITGFANNNNLKKDDFQRRTENEKLYILSWYNKKETGDIAKHLGLTTKQVNHFAYKQGLMRDIEKYVVDNDYFKAVDSEEKAYWLGFLYADGCIQENYKKEKLKGIVLDVGLAIVDENHLKKLLKSLKSNVKIKYKNIKKYKACRISICNTELCRDLIKLGCTPKKSLTLKYPNKNTLPKRYNKDFIRGYFDGDGCVHINEENKTFVVSFVGTEDFLLKLRENLVEELGLSKTKIRKKGNSFEVRWSGKKNLHKFKNYFYNNSNIYLERKKQKFSKLPSIK